MRDSLLGRGYRLLRGSSFVATTVVAFVIVTAVGGTWIASTGGRLALGVALALLLPWTVRTLLKCAVKRRVRAAARLGGVWFLVGAQLALSALLCLGFSNSTGRALRRRGDWFLGTTKGWAPEGARALLASAAGWMERFDVAPEAKALLGDALRPQPIHADKPRQAPVDVTGAAALIPVGPAWYHPLPARRGRRVMAPNASCRFGAYRAGVRRTECELGHCGVDLAGPTGTPVFAAYDGVVIRAERDTVRGGRAGRYIIMRHKGGELRTYYIHLHSLRPGLRYGTRVRGGEQIGTVGRTGMKRSGAHLHFAIEVRPRSGRLYIDPEPLLLFWRLRDPAVPLAPGDSAVAGSRTRTRTSTSTSERTSTSTSTRASAWM